MSCPRPSPLTPIAPDIWISDGPVVVAALGFHYPTRMTVIRLADGGLFVHSPVALSDALRAAVQALGPVRHIVAPNDLHHLSIPDWQAAFPDALTHAAPGLRAKRPDIRWDADLTDTPPPAWAGQIGQIVLRGHAITTEVVFHHVASGAIIFTDWLQNLPPGWFRGWRGLVAQLDLMVEAEPTVPRKFRLACRDREAVRLAVRTLLRWNPECVLMAHGDPVRADAAAFLRRAFAWLD